MKTALAAAFAATLLTGACASDPYNDNQAVRQGAQGAALGAIAGAIIGNNTGRGGAARGAAIGAALGGTVGVIRGSAEDRRNQQRYREDDGRYFYCYDNRRSECYWEDGRRR